MSLSEEQTKRLAKLYSASEAEILEEINQALLRGSDIKYLEGMKKNVQAILTDLNKGSKDWCEKAIPQVYTGGMELASKELKKAHINVASGFGAIHQQAGQVLADNAFGRFKDVSDFIGRRTDDIYRTVALESVRGTVAGYKTWQNVAESHRKKLAEEGITGFKDKAGKQWNMRTYAEMVARTTTMEAHVQGTANRLLENGQDLIKVTTHGDSCSMCTPWQGKVLSLTGKTEGYPTLEEAKSQGLFHPNCGHDFGLYIEDFGKEEEPEIESKEVKLQKELDKIKWTKGMDNELKALKTDARVYAKNNVDYLDEHGTMGHSSSFPSEDKYRDQLVKETKKTDFVEVYRKRVLTQIKVYQQTIKDIERDIIMDKKLGLLNDARKERIMLEATNALKSRHKALIKQYFEEFTEEAATNKTVEKTLLEKIVDIKAEAFASNAGKIGEPHVKQAGKLVMEELDDRTELKEKVEALQRELDETRIEKKKEELQRLKQARRGLLSFEDVGVANKAELEARLTELDEEIFLKLRPLARDIEDRLSMAKSEYRGKVKENAKELKDKLSEIRKMGHDNKFDLNLQGRSPMKKVVSEAYDCYPNSWIKKSVSKGRALKPKKTDRGYYNGWDIAISGTNDNSCYTTAVHELGHRYEDVIPEIRELEKAFYDQRTAGEDLEWLGNGYSKDEKTRKDNFVEHYMGKDYGGSAYELVSMGFQLAYTNPMKLRKDKEMAEWIYGLLALI